MPVDMIDPGSWSMIALSFIGAQVAHKAANGTIQAIWDKYSVRFLATFKAAPAAEQSSNQAIEVLEANPEIAKSVTEVLLASPALRRARAVPQVLDGARILWIDDNPENNEWERAMLRTLRAEVTAVTRTDS